MTASSGPTFVLTQGRREPLYVVAPGDRPELVSDVEIPRFLALTVELTYRPGVLAVHGQGGIAVYGDAG